MLIAHRGMFNDCVKENSIEAFKRAINSDKYKGFECDVYTTLDKVFVVNHDPIINGKVIRKTKYKELKKEGIPRLVDVLNLKTDKLVLIEIKDININILEFSKLLNKYKNKNIYVMSFFNSVIKKFKDVPFKVGLLNYVINSNASYNYDFIGIFYGMATNNMIEYFKVKNIEVFLYGLFKNSKYIYNNVYYIVDDYIK